GNGRDREAEEARHAVVLAAAAEQRVDRLADARHDEEPGDAGTERNRRHDVAERGGAGRGIRLLRLVLRPDDEGRAAEGGGARVAEREELEVVQPLEDPAEEERRPRARVVDDRARA